jgi:hypothetical protein
MKHHGHIYRRDEKQGSGWVRTKLSGYDYQVGDDGELDRTQVVHHVGKSKRVGDVLLGVEISHLAGDMRE